MLSASLYITACSTRNRVLRSVKRLREPRYLIGFLALAAYLYFMFFGTFGRVRARPPAAVIPGAGAFTPILAAGLFAFAAISWLFPVKSRLLEFSQAEVQFLVPAPVTRRALLVHRLLRMQAGMFFGALVPALIYALPRKSFSLGVQTAFAVWVLFLEAVLYFSAVEPSRARLMSTDARERAAARLPLLATLGAGFVVVRAIAREWSTPAAAGAAGLLPRLESVLSSGPSTTVLWPFAAVLRPLLAVGWRAYGAAIAGALVVVGITACWLLVTDGIFHSRAIEIDERLIDKAHDRRVTYAARGQDWALAPSGRPEVAFLWKTTMQIFRVVDRRIVIRFTLIVVMLTAVVVMGFRHRGPSSLIGIIAAAAAAYATFLGPQLVRLDFRQDLEHLDLLKTWPVRAAAIVRGEIAGPALAMSAFSCALIGLALLCSASAFPNVSVGVRLAAGAAALLLSPTLIVGQYAIHNTLAVVFPAWVPLGAGRARGAEAMGQRMLTVYGAWFALIVMLLPGAAVSAVLWLAFYRLLGMGMLVVVAVVCAAAMALEVLVMTEALGPAYERLDLLAVERPE